MKILIAVYVVAQLFCQVVEGHGQVERESAAGNYDRAVRLELADAVGNSFAGAEDSDNDQQIKIYSVWLQALFCPPPVGKKE